MLLKCVDPYTAKMNWTCDFNSRF